MTMTDNDQEYLIIRNSKSTTRNNVQYYCSKIEDDGISATSDLDDETTSLHNDHASLSIVRLVESSDGNYMLDFDDDNSPVVTSFLSDHIISSSCSSSNDYKTFIQSDSLKYLRNFAELVRVELPSNADTAMLLNDELEDHDKSALLIDHFGRDNFYRLPEDVGHVLLHTLLPLESLFSWPTLAKARDEGYINWKDIRFFLTQGKRGAPFMITAASEGALQHIIKTHITFQQFVIFARLVEHHLQKLPCVRLSVHQSSTISVDIQLRSDQNCTVRIGVMNENDCKPTARQFTDDERRDNTFISFECIQLAAGDKKIVRLEGLKSSTLYKVYIHISKPSVEFHVQSTDGDVLKSLLIVETQDYHLIDIFSEFSLMTKEEQRIELMASIKDKSVRMRAQADGLVIPDVEEEPGDNCSEAWRLYVEWWQDNLDTRYDFCVRELLYASKDHGVRQNYAQQDGTIAMNQSRSKDRVKREQWMRAFGSWYYNRNTSTAETGNYTDSQHTFRNSAEEEIQYQSFASVHTLNLPKSEEDESSTINRFIPTFQGKANQQQEAKDETDDMEDCTDSLGEHLVLTAQGIARPTLSLPAMALEVSDLTSTLQADVVMPSERESSPLQPLQQNHCEEKKTPIRWPESDALQEAPTKPPPKRPSKSRLTIGVVGQVVSFRQRFLRRLSARIDTCLVQLRPKTPSSLRGIALFRAKVRLVMLLQKVSNKPFSSLNDVDIFSYQRRNTRSTTPKAVTSSLHEEEVEEDDDLSSMEMATGHYKDKLARKVFTCWRTWASGLVAEKRAQEEKKMLAAMEAFNAFLLRKYFQAFVEAVKTNKETTTEEGIESPIVDVENFCMMDEDEECCIFTTSWKTCVDMYCRIDRSSSTRIDHQQLITHSSNPRRFNMLDKDQLRSMRRAKLSGASNLYDVPESLCRFDDLADEKRPLYRAREIAKSIIVSTKA